MTSKETILAAVLENQPGPAPLPDINIFFKEGQDFVQQYADTFTGIGGNIFLVNDIESVKALAKEHFDFSKRIITTLPELSDIAELYSLTVDPHTFNDVELAVIRARLGVAENGAVWLSENLVGQRIIPYICDISR